MNIRVASAAAVVACLAPVAFADLDLDWDGMAAHESILYSFDSSATWDAAERTRDAFAFAGLLSFNEGAVEVFCIELEVPVSQNAPATYTVGPFDAGDADLQSRLAVLASLFDGYYDQVVTTRDDATAAAFAMLTWEIMSEQFTGADIVSEMSLDLGAAQFGEYSGDAALAAADMQSYLSSNPSADASGLLRYSNDSFQDFVGVPAPGALALLGVAGGVLSTRRRRG